mmetsp:Transcript_41016/g.100019  ORF Transcript_41016/g.100019 Transcript_41016/m.100019 type:complete len:251 (+) Transcript_41016:706-1458(+)
MKVQGPPEIKFGAPTVHKTRQASPPKSGPPLQMPPHPPSAALQCTHRKSARDREHAEAAEEESKPLATTLQRIQYSDKETDFTPPRVSNSPKNLHTAQPRKSCASASENTTKNTPSHKEAKTKGIGPTLGLRWIGSVNTCTKGGVPLFTRVSLQYSTRLFSNRLLWTVSKSHAAAQRWSLLLSLTAATAHSRAVSHSPPGGRSLFPLRVLRSSPSPALPSSSSSPLPLPSPSRWLSFPSASCPGTQTGGG